MHSTSTQSKRLAVCTFILHDAVYQTDSDIYIGAPCVTQSDRGTENFNVAYAHTHIRHMLDPSLSGSIQHQWMHGHSNIKPEQMWSRLRRMWAPGFEGLLQKGISRQWYDDVNVADRYAVCHIRACFKTYRALEQTGFSLVGHPLAAEGS